MVHSKPLIIGIPRERMQHEGRVPLLPLTIVTLRTEISNRSLKFLVEEGVGSETQLGLNDEIWRDAGATVVDDVSKLYKKADIILKVKQPLPEEVEYCREGQGSVCFHHSAANRETVQALLKKGVMILPLEYHRPSLASMSRHTGKWIPLLISTFLGGECMQKDVFFGGARGMVCQYAIRACQEAGMRPSRIHAFDLVAGKFNSPETGLAYRTFSSEDEEELCERLSWCSIAVLAAVGKDGAPKFLKPHHLACMPDGVLIIQVSIDEGGNIDDPEFCRVTHWGGWRTTYEVIRDDKSYRICNLPNIPGCVMPREASIALDQASFPYYVELLSRWPDVPEQYVFRGSRP